MSHCPSLIQPLSSIELMNLENIYFVQKIAVMYLFYYMYVDHECFLSVQTTTELGDRLLCLDEQGVEVHFEGDDQAIVSDVTINDGKWHFVALTWGSTLGHVNIYVDGVLNTLSGYHAGFTLPLL